MSQFNEREEWYQFNRETVDALLTDGSSQSAKYDMEHHLASANFEDLEKAAVDAFKAGFEVSDAEELVLDDGGVVFCFDAVRESELDLSVIDKDTDSLLQIADKHKVHYDGWGTHFIPTDEEDEE